MRYASHRLRRANQSASVSPVRRELPPVGRRRAQTCNEPDLGSCKDRESTSAVCLLEFSLPFEQSIPASTAQYRTVETGGEQRISALQALIRSLTQSTGAPATVLQAISKDSLAWSNDAGIQAILEYRQTSPTALKRNPAPAFCQACGAQVRRLIQLLPCKHLACAACCASGLNKVTANPPRPHTCAGCQNAVDGIELNKIGMRDSRFDSQPFRQRESNSLWHSVLTAINSENQRQTARPEIANGEHDPNGEHEQRLLQQLPCVIRVDNIAWAVKYEDVVDWLPEHAARILASGRNLVLQAIHIPIDVQSGKTANCCFVECVSKDVAYRIIRSRNNSRLCGRPVSESYLAELTIRPGDADRLTEFWSASAVMLATVDELLGEFFGKHAPIRAATEACRSDSFVKQSSIYPLVTLLREGAPQLKSPLKTIDHATSVIRLAHLAAVRLDPGEVFTTAKEIVVLCIAKAPTLEGVRAPLERLLHACSECSLLSGQQRMTIMETAYKALIDSSIRKDDLSYSTMLAPTRKNYNKPEVDETLADASISNGSSTPSFIRMPSFIGGRLSEVSSEASEDTAGIQGHAHNPTAVLEECAPYLGKDGPAWRALLDAGMDPYASPTFGRALVKVAQVFARQELEVSAI